MYRSIKRSGQLGLCISFLLFVAGFVNEVSAQNSESSENPFNIGLTYTADIFSNVYGGYDQGIRFMDNVDAELSYDLISDAGVSNTRFYIYGLGNQGSSITELTQDVQGVSNIEAESSWRIYEAWIQQNIFPLRTSVLAGLYDINTEFDVINSAALFINSSHGIGAEFASSGVLGPSTFPYTSLGLRIKSNPWEGFVIKFAMLDGIPSDPQNSRGTKIFFRERDGLLLAGEISLFSDESQQFNSMSRSSRLHHFLSRSTSGDGKYKVAFGAWGYTKKRVGWLEEKQRNKGMYMLGEYKIFNEQMGLEQGLDGFIRIGIANGGINPFDGYSGLGLVYTGLFKNRDNDKAGIALAIPWTSSEYSRFQEDAGQPLEDYELNIEGTYQFTINPYVMLQVNLQYIVNPGLLTNRKNAIVPGIRVQFMN